MNGRSFVTPAPERVRLLAGLCENIIASRQAEIEQVKAKLRALDKCEDKTPRGHARPPSLRRAPFRRNRLALLFYVVRP